MKPVQLLQLLQHISEKTHCPHCNAKIFPEDIKIKYTFDSSVFITIDCHKCRTQADAHVVASYRGSKPKFEEFTDISESEITEAHGILEKFNGDIDALFQQKK